MSSRKVAKLLALVVAGAVGCGPAVGDAPGVERDAGRVTLTVRTAGRGPMYVEGALHYAAIRGAGGEVVFRGRIPGRALAEAVEPGTYRVAHWARPCVANCAQGLDAPTDRCSARLEVAQDTTAVVRLRARGGCTISSGG